MPSAAGNLTWSPLLDRLDLVAPPVAAAAPLVPGARVAEIDPALADTAACCAAYDLAPEAAANCVVVAGSREGVRRWAAVMILATDRVDANRVVRKHLGVRKLSFAAAGEAEALTGMRQGGITPVGLPDDWALLIDTAVVAAGPVIIGGGVRGAKILLEGAALAGLPHAEVLDLALPSS